MKDKSKTFRISSEDIRRADEIKQRHRVSDADIFEAGLQAYNAGQDDYKSAADAAERDLIAINQRRRDADLEEYFKRLRDYAEGKKSQQLW